MRLLRPTFALLLVASVPLFATLGCEPSPVPPTMRTPEWAPQPAASSAAAPAPALPEAPEKVIVIGRCTMCHDENYLAQQRLTPGQWQKTVEKMKNFGSPMSDEETAQISAYLARSFPVDLADTKPVLVPKPTATYRYR